MVNFQSFNGIVNMISDFPIGQNDESAGCYKLISVDNGFGNVVNFVVPPTTYFVDQFMAVVGDRITGFYDANAPVPLIYPPQYRAIVMAKDNPYQNVKVDYFNSQLVSSDGMLKLNNSSNTHNYIGKWASLYRKSFKQKSNCGIWRYHQKYTSPN